MVSPLPAIERRESAAGCTLPAGDIAKTPPLYQRPTWVLPLAERMPKSGREYQFEFVRKGHPAAAWSRTTRRRCEQIAIHVVKRSLKYGADAPRHAVDPRADAAHWPREDAVLGVAAA
jgi:hypothetical protein